MHANGAHKRSVCFAGATHCNVFVFWCKKTYNQSGLANINTYTKEL
ncbi:hypothetical protein ARMA_2509 [Ardenticatena maritima]|uniref:Uncharacterized protein n=1 Tax=Ardenticatena maritima TaxID=872965 RepID=A0A0M8KB94_9CHLR|nr:hypothetical protein ARMA_2509 [Ardenticatena maritima]